MLAALLGTLWTAFQQRSSFQTVTKASDSETIETV
jgi:hypothetical protein